MDGNVEAGLFSRPYVAAVIVAAGSSERMRGADKQFLPLSGIPVLARSLMAFERCESIGEIVVVARPEKLDAVRALAEEYKVTKLVTVVPGGETRALSVARGAAEVSGKTEYIAIHDGARPLVLPADISRCVEDACFHGAAVLGRPVTDTIKYVRKNGCVGYTPVRDKLFAVQTPQIFQLHFFLEELAAAGERAADWTDDSLVFENAGRRVYITIGSRDNIKITGPEDIVLAEALLKFREERGV